MTSSATRIDGSSREWADEQTCRTYCAVCDWAYVGTVAEGRKQAAEHRAEHHPGMKRTRRRRGSLARFRNNQDDFRSEGLANAKEVAAMLKRRESEAA